MSDFSWSLLIWSAVNYWRTIWRILMSELTVTLEQHPTGKKWLWERCCRDPFPFFILWSLNEKCVCALCKNAPRSPQSWFSPPRKHALVLTMPHSLGGILIAVHFNVVFKIWQCAFGVILCWCSCLLQYVLAAKMVVAGSLQTVSHVSWSMIMST